LSQPSARTPDPELRPAEPAASGSKFSFGKTITLGLFGLHLLIYIILWSTGKVSPIGFISEIVQHGKLDDKQLFHLLVLVGNAVIAFLTARGKCDALLGGGCVFLSAAHAFVGQNLTPDALTTGAMLMVSILLLYVGVRIHSLMSPCYWWTLVASYFGLFFIFVRIRWETFIPGGPTTGMANAEPLLLLFLMGLAACARSLRMLAFFWALVLSFTFCQPYAWPTLLISYTLLAAIFTARGSLPSRTAIVFLTLGLALVFLVLFPVVVTLTGESLFSIEKVIRENSAFRSALLNTVWTASLSTVILLIIVVPLAYAISRLRFRGRTLLLSLLDLPIVIPQSVAGLLLLRALGSNQYLGQMLESRFGIRFEGTFVGICMAQIFVALPFMARSAIAAFDAVPQKLEAAAQTLGASSLGAFSRVALPLASRGIFLGAVLAWARAAGEFGALLFIAQNPKTAPIMISDIVAARGTAEAAPAVAALLLFSIVMFFLLQFASRMMPSNRGRLEEEK
jgi:molybdate/tungstate transport system permease protein